MEAVHLEGRDHHPEEDNHLVRIRRVIIKSTKSFFLHIDDDAGCLLPDASITTRVIVMMMIIDDDGGDACC